MELFDGVQARPRQPNASWGVGFPVRRILIGLRRGG